MTPNPSPEAIKAVQSDLLRAFNVLPDTVAFAKWFHDNADAVIQAGIHAEAALGMSDAVESWTLRLAKEYCDLHPCIEEAHDEPMALVLAVKDLEKETCEACVRLDCNGCNLKPVIDAAKEA